MTRRLHSIIATKLPLRLTATEYLLMDDELRGLCRSCGHERAGCEPDARRYPCDHCKADQVYGVEELLARGELEFIE